MKQKTMLFGAAILGAAAIASAGFSWSGADLEFRVISDIDNGTDKSGYWYMYDDHADGGASTITWPVTKGNDYDTSALDPIIEHCGGVCGHFALDKGTLDYNPFVGIGFNVAGTETEEGGVAMPGDASAWGGICITYTVDINAVLELGMGDTKDAEIKYNNPVATLPKSSTANSVCKEWDKFKQGWPPKADEPVVTGADAAAALASVKFKIQAVSGEGDFNIISVSSAVGGSVGIKAARAASSVKAIVANGQLFLDGVKSPVSAEIVNLQGQVVLKSTINASASINLASLDAGVYLVRVAGKSVDFSQKIILK